MSAATRPTLQFGPEILAESTAAARTFAQTYGFPVMVIPSIVPLTPLRTDQLDRHVGKTAGSIDTLPPYGPEHPIHDQATLRVIVAAVLALGLHASVIRFSCHA